MHLRRKLTFLQKTLVAVLVTGGFYSLLSGAMAPAYEILGVQTVALVGNDLTDLDNDGDPENDSGYDAVFDANEEPGFGGGEFAFNVFDNALGGGNAKWCCGPGGGIPDEGLWISAQLSGPHVLTSVTVSSANDVAARDPIDWAVQGSNNAVDYTDIYVFDAGASPWDQRLQVIEFNGGDDFPIQTVGYEYFRFVTYDTEANPDGAYYQVGEIEYFGRPGTGGDLGTPANFVAGVGRIGEKELQTSRQNEVTGGAGEVTPGLVHEWFLGSNPGNKDGVDAVFESEQPIVPPFKAAHGESWWTGNESANSPVLDGLVQYPDEVQPPLNGSGNDNYMARLTGEILIPESGSYRFTDGVDDYTYLAIDIDKSGVAGDDFDEVLIDDNAWTSVLRADNSGGQGFADVDIDVGEGGEWLAFEFNMAEGGGDDAGIIYWDYNPDAPEGQRLGGAEGFPEFPEDPIFDEIDAADMYIPNTHLRSESTGELISADLVATLSDSKAWEFDVDGNADTADLLVVPNRDPNLFTTVLDLNGAELRIVGTGSLQSGDTFTIVDADQINGNFTITAGAEGQSWTFNPATGEITLGGAAAPALQAGDANMDLQFDQLDLVQVQIAAKYLTGQAATWGEGDWNAAPGGSQGNPPAGNGLFDQADIVAALTGGKYLQGFYGALSGPEGSGDGSATIVYDATTGELRVEVPATQLTAVNITSAAGIFTGDPADNLAAGGFDNDTDENIFKSTFGTSFGSLSFGNVAQTGLSEEFVTNDLTVIGALAGGGGLGAVDLRYIPEPSSMVLLALGLAGGLLMPRRRRS